MVAEYTPVCWPFGLTLMVKVFPDVVAVNQVAVGVPALIGGVFVELGLSVPTMVAVWLFGTEPLFEANVAEEGLPKSTAVFAGATSRVTVTEVVPLGVVTLTVAV